MGFKEDLLAEFDAKLAEDIALKDNHPARAEHMGFMGTWIDQVLRSNTSSLIYIMAHDTGNPMGRVEVQHGGAISKDPLSQMFGLRVVMAEIDRRIPKPESDEEDEGSGT